MMSLPLLEYIVLLLLSLLFNAILYIRVREYHEETKKDKQLYCLKNIDLFLHLQKHIDDEIITDKCIIELVKNGLKNECMRYASTHEFGSKKKADKSDEKE